MALDPRISKAFSAMKGLGIPIETVKPVLKRLLKLYDRNWELIEEDNYRTLADAIFECADDEEPFSDRLKDPILSQVIPADRKLSSETTSCSLFFNQVIDGPDYIDMQKEKTPKDHEDEDLIKPKLIDGSDCIDMQKEKTPPKDHQDEGLIKPKLSVHNFPHNAIPTLMGHSALPGTLEDSPTVYNSSKRLKTQSMDKDNKDNGSGCNGRSYERSFDIVSSTFGEVKISLNCNSALRPSFHTPNLDSVLKFLEDKYLRSYKIVGPQFSVMNLLKELCEIYLQLGNDFNGRSVRKRSSAVDWLHHTVRHDRESLRAGDSERNLCMKESNCSGSSNSLSLVVAQQQPTFRAKKRSFRKVSDITKGTEKVRVSLLDEIGHEHLPNFVYIPQNTIYQNAYVHVSLSRISDEDCCMSCIGDCLSSSVPCACARDTGGEFAYTPQGLLKEEFLRACISMNEEPQKHYHFYCQDCPLERAKHAFRPEPCKGHLVRKFIKECWKKCGCNMQCGNRVVQRGITCNLQVFLTKDSKGWGLRTLEELPKGAFVCEYVGEILTNMELYERNTCSGSNERHTYPVLLDADWGSEGVLKDEDALCLDATYYGNVARFINHRCFDANLLEIPVEVETPDHHYYHLSFFTKRKVDALEELTWDYGIDFDDHNHPIKAFQCCCGSAFCRDMKRKEKIKEIERKRSKGLAT